MSDDDGLSDEELDEIVENERRNHEDGQFSSNPELTNAQLREMFPELSDHWR